jgi:hypothetical protein
MVEEGMSLYSWTMSSTGKANFVSHNQLDWFAALDAGA